MADLASDAQLCAQSRRSDGAHSWEFDGDDPYVRCVFCSEIRDALSGHGLPGPDPLLRMMAGAVVMVPESAVAEAVAAERKRVIAVARKLGASYPVALEPPPGSEGSTRHAWFPFGDYLQDVPIERQGEQPQ